MITIFSTSKHLMKIQVEKHGYWMTIMQVGIVACLGWKKSPGRSVVKPRKDLLETVLSRRSCLRTRAKRSFSQCQTIVKMKPIERARQNKEVGFGITSFGVTDKKIWSVFCQGPIYNEKIFKQGPGQKNRMRSREICFRKAKT